MHIRKTVIYEIQGEQVRSASGSVRGSPSAKLIIDFPSEPHQVKEFRQTLEKLLEEELRDCE